MKLQEFGDKNHVRYLCLVASYLPCLFPFRVTSSPHHRKEVIMTEDKLWNQRVLIDKQTLSLTNSVILRKLLNVSKPHMKNENRNFFLVVLQGNYMMSHKHLTQRRCSITGGYEYIWSHASTNMQQHTQLCLSPKITSGPNSMINKQTCLYFLCWYSVI